MKEMMLYHAIGEMMEVDVMCIPCPTKLYTVLLLTQVESYKHLHNFVCGEFNGSICELNVLMYHIHSHAILSTVYRYL